MAGIASFGPNSSTRPITLVPRTDADVDNSRYEAKVPYEAMDDYGNTATLYRKVEVRPEQLAAERARLEARIVEIDELVAEVEKAVS
jgi:hypothetical protein